MDGGVRLGLMMAACACIAIIALRNVMTSAGIASLGQVFSPDRLVSVVITTTLTTWALLLGVGIVSAARKLRT